MALNNFAGLKASIADWLNRADLEPVIPSFIDLATSRIQRDMARVRHPSALSKRVVTFSDASAPLPLDLVTQYQLMHDSHVLEYVPPQEIGHCEETTNAAAWHSQLSYTIFGTNMWLVPDSAAEYPIDLTLYYYAALPALSDTNPTNWALQRYPDLYLYGALTHTAPYLKSDERIALWDGLYNRILGDIDVEAERAVRSQTKLVSARRSL